MRLDVSAALTSASSERILVSCSKVFARLKTVFLYIV